MIWYKYYVLNSKILVHMIGCLPILQTSCLFFFFSSKKYNFSTNIQEIEYYKSHLYNHGRSFIETQERVKQAAIAPVRPQKSATTSALIDLHEKMWTHLSGEELLNILVGQIIMSYCLTHFFQILPKSWFKQCGIG